MSSRSTVSLRSLFFVKKRGLLPVGDTKNIFKKNIEELAACLADFFFSTL
jgi:hypothetical protein